MTRHIPNLLTAGRFVLALVLFAVLGAYDGPPRDPEAWPLLDIAMALFLIAALTDAVDGYLARALGHVTTFGRIADPFVDKIVVCGTLAYLIGQQFVVMQPDGSVENLTGWQPWMVVAIVARELLVTGMRSFSESHGISFAATMSGKVKMFLQCFAIIWTIVYVGHWTDGPAWTRVVRDVLAWGTALFTVFTGLAYIKRAYQLLRMPPD
jgi:CDP-diacylglycerol--glycerol-3-phosphate 3-phosphatidyltransferase